MAKFWSVPRFGSTIRSKGQSKQDIIYVRERILSPWKMIPLPPKLQTVGCMGELNCSIWLWRSLISFDEPVILFQSVSLTGENKSLSITNSLDSCIEILHIETRPIRCHPHATHNNKNGLSRFSSPDKWILNKLWCCIGRIQRSNTTHESLKRIREKIYERVSSVMWQRKGLIPNYFNA